MKILLSEASDRLELLFASLGRTSEIYGLDVTVQRGQLNEISERVNGFKDELARLEVELAKLDRRLPTLIELTATPNPLRVEDALEIVGVLRSDAGLGERTVEVWINGFRVANITSDGHGNLRWAYLIPSTVHWEELEIFARFTPIGEDVTKFRPARSPTLTILVSYRTAVLTAFMQLTRLHVHELFIVQGTLTDEFGQPLAGRSIESLLDGVVVGSAETDRAGSYILTALIPEGILEGHHKLQARFEPTEGVFASTRSNEIDIEVYYVRPRIGMIELTGVSIVGDKILLISGQRIQLGIRFEFDSGLFLEEVLSVHLGGRELGRWKFSTISGGTAASGSSQVVQTILDITAIMNVPFDATGETTLEIFFEPSQPWFEKAAASIQLTVVNLAFVGSAIGSVTFAGLMLSGRAVQLERVSTRSRRPEEMPARGHVTEVGLARPILHLEALRNIQEPVLRLRETYWEARRLLAERLGHAGRSSETPREYLARVGLGLNSAFGSFSKLTELFEFAQYSQRTLSQLEAQQAVNHAVVIAEAIDAEVKG